MQIGKIDRQERYIDRKDRQIEIPVRCPAKNQYPKIIINII